MGDVSMDVENTGVSSLQEVSAGGVDIVRAKYDPVYASSLSLSDLEKISVTITAEHPQIIAFIPGNLFDGVYSKVENMQELSLIGSLIANRHNEIINDMLDAWNENLQKEAAINLEEAKKKSVLQGYIHWSENQSPSVKIEQIDTKSIEVTTNVRDSGNYQEYLRSLPINQRYEEIRTASGSIAENYLHSSRADIQNEDLAKAALSALLVQALVITPMAQLLVISPIEQSSLSSQIAVKPAVEQNIFPQSIPLQQDLLPAINLFALELAKDITIMMYVKNQDPAKETMLEFAKNYANEALERTKNIEAVIAKLIETIPDARHLTTNELYTAAKLAQLFMLANALMLFVKAEGGANLQENELQQLLSGQGIPKGDVREKVIVRMNTILQSVPLEQRAEIAELLLKYVGSNPKTERLSDFLFALTHAMQEINHAQRAVQHPID